MSIDWRLTDVNWRVQVRVISRNLSEQGLRRNTFITDDAFPRLLRKKQNVTFVTINVKYFLGMVPITRHGSGMTSNQD
jgi:hypothetical protein